MNAPKNFMKILVVGERPEEQVAKYDLMTKVAPYVAHSYDNMRSDRKKAIKVLSNVLTNKDIIPLTSYLSTSLVNLIDNINNMTDLEYYLKICEGCKFDENTGNAISDVNKNAEYQYATDYDKICRKVGENVGFIQPFILKDGTLAFKAKKGEVDWKKTHGANKKEYKKVWELCVEGIEPADEREKKIYEDNYQSVNYFNTFNTVDEYIIHNCNFWCDGIIIDGKYIKNKGDQRDWEECFFKKYIKPLNNDTQLTLYEAKSI
jgi:hypothetical protein